MPNSRSAPNPRDAAVTLALLELEPVPFRTPLKFGGRIVDQTDLLNVTVMMRGRDGATAQGFGSMPVGHIWAWPSESVSAEAAYRVMVDFLQRVIAITPRAEEFGHPIDLVLSLHGEFDRLAHEAMAAEFGADTVPEPMPKLAQLVAASPLDAAIHDAYGRLHGISSYNALGAEFMNHDLSKYLGERFAGEYLDQYTRREPMPEMPLYHLVGALDPITGDDIDERIDDGLPETLGEWVIADGLTHLKIKLSGEDLGWDVQRVLSIEAEVSRAQQERGRDSWFYSCDFNERCESVDYVLEFLQQVREASPAAYDRIQYLEQPTHRDLKAHPENTMHEAAKLKPVVIDESLIDLEALTLAKELGYTGVALKACKGQTESLLIAAAAQKDDLFLCVQDLTCPGYSFLHSASLAARIPSIAAIEGNGRQYCPAPNTNFAPDFPGMFDVSDGSVKTTELDGIGLGFRHPK